MSLRGYVVRHRQWTIIAGVLIILLIAIVVPLLLLHAAVQPVAFEPENGSPSSHVGMITDATASNGKAVQFTAGGGGSACASTATRICYNGTQWFMNGVNVPWYNWGADFGGTTGGGVTSTKAALATSFATLKADNVHVVRWWLFEGGANQITRDSSGKPTGISPGVYTDIDAALDLANTYDLYYTFTIFAAADDFPATWRTDATQRTQLAQVLAPLFARYKDNPHVMTWEIFNEPEWQIDGTNVKQDDVKNMARAIITQIRSNAPSKLVTVGQNLINAIPIWTDVDLDYYSPHWYDNHTSADICALCTTAGALQTKYHTTKPILIGEYSMVQGGTAQQNVDRQNKWYNQGYAGAWGWSLLFDHTNDRIQVYPDTMKTFDAQHTDIGPHQ